MELRDSLCIDEGLPNKPVIACRKRKAWGQSGNSRYLGHELCLALWLAQGDIYGISMRRPYVMVGLPFVAIRRNSVDAVSHTENAYLKGIAHWIERTNNSPLEEIRQNAERASDFLINDLQAFRENLELGRRSRH